MDVIVQFCLQNVPVLSLFSSYTPHEKLARHTVACATVQCVHYYSSGRLYAVEIPDELYMIFPQKMEKNGENSRVCSL